MDETGSINHVGSGIISRDLLDSQDGPGRLTNVLKSLGVGTTGHVLAGGAIVANAKTVDSVNKPSMAKSHHAHYIRPEVGSKCHARRAVDGEDTMGAYLNEANA